MYKITISSGGISVAMEMDSKDALTQEVVNMLIAALVQADKDAELCNRRLSVQSPWRGPDTYFRGQYGSTQIQPPQWPYGTILCGSES